jgi:hypothetical protein
MSVPKIKRSGGPQSSEGKLVASRNAIRSGAYASITVLPGEDIQQYKALEEQFFKDFSPADLAESAMVRDLASLTWKKLRLDRLEHQALLRELARRITYNEIKLHLGVKPRADVDWVFDQMDQVDEAWVSDAKGDLEFVEKMQSFDRSTIDVAALTRQSSSFAHALSRSAEEYGVSNLKALLISGKVSSDYGITQVPFWDVVFSKISNEASDILWVWEHRDELKRAIQQEKDQRLVKFLMGDELRRAHDDLGRAFYKTLAELRKHQEWRSRRAIDVTPENATGSSEA